MSEHAGNRPPNAAPTAEIEAFLARTLPFSDLEPPVIRRLAAAMHIDFVPKDVLMYERGVTPVEDLVIIQTGGLKMYLPGPSGEETLVDFRGPGAAIGALGMIRGSLANLYGVTVDDTFLYRLPKSVFLELVREEPAVGLFFLEDFTESYISRAFMELRERRLAPRAAASLALMSSAAKDAQQRPPVLLAKEATVREAARRMTDADADAILLTDASGEPVGVMTDKDLRARVLAQDLPLDIPCEHVMSAPVLAIDSRATGFDALLTMLEKQVRHLAVTTQGKVTGLVSTHDIQLLQGRSPFALGKEIAMARDFATLCSLSRSVPAFVRSLVEEGARARVICRAITLLNDQVLERLLLLAQAELGPPPAAFCWIAMGSEGRREQTFRTDQDNGLIYDDKSIADPVRRAAAEAYFARLGEEAVRRLVECGYPLCPGEIMASNPAWRRSLSGWKDVFSRWIAAPNPQEVLNSTIFFDFRPAFGHLTLGESLRRDVSDMARRNEIFLAFMARDAVAKKPPLTFFNNFIVEKDGEHKNRLDIKIKAIAPFVDLARVLALRHGVTATESIERLERLEDDGFLSTEVAAEAREALEFLIHLRLSHQLRQLENDRTPDNHIDPADLSPLERKSLKEIFGLLGRLQNFVAEELRLNM